MVARPAERIKHIVIAVDGSEHSLAAVKFVRDLSIDNIACPGCLVTIVGALNPLDSATHATYKPPLTQAQKILQERSFQVNTELILGYPAEILINYAEKNNPDLIVMGAKGLRATLGILLGGVAQQVIEYANCPVLIVRAPYRQLRHILLVTDGSSSSYEAAGYLTHFPLPKEVHLTIAHVLRPEPKLDPAFLIQTWSLTNDTIQDVTQSLTPEEIQRHQQEEEKKGQALLNQTLHLFDDVPIPNETILLHGDAATEIIEYSKKHNIDLVVAGSRGLSEMKAWLLGSVSRKLVHYAPCSVLIVRN